MLMLSLRPWRHIFSDCGASVSLISAAAVMSLLAVAGLSIDSALAFLVQARMSKAVDAAGLAAARNALTDDVNAEAQKFFYANFPNGYLGSTVTNVSAVADADNRVITVAAEATLPTRIMHLFGSSSLTVGARALIERQTRGMELVLVMDNTGSMRSGGMITAMKNAAADLVNIVYGDEETAEHLYVGLVPYTAMVNIGSGRSDWLDPNDQLFDVPGPFEPTAWKGCVRARSGGLDEDDTTPGIAPFNSFLYQADVDNVWPPIDDRNDAQNDGTGPNLGCGPAITPLVAEKSTVLAAIDEMLPWHRGGTTGNLGLVWGWRVVSPAWRGLWGLPSPPALPLDYDTPLMDKVVILLTDGDNQFYKWPGANGPDGSDDTAYGRLLQFDNGAYPTLALARDELDGRLARTCQAMKAQGILLYTITFGSTPNSGTQALYRNCASKPEFYFHSPSNDDLAAAFRTIGGHLSNLRIME